MNCPPTKRLRGLSQDRATAETFDDPFGDDEDFTQDDLAEIDIIASQAITSATAFVHGSKKGTKPVDHDSDGITSAGQSKTTSRNTTNQSVENMCGFKRGNAGMSIREPLVNRQQQFGSGRQDSTSLLEAQHADLKRKLKEVEEEIMLKTGEIRVLRDSLKAAQQEKETQRENQLLLEKEKQREQSEREKELNRKVQSLQSELQFKEAEINEMKNKLHNSDRSKTASPLRRNSPKVQNCLAQVHHGSGCSSSSPTGNGFITKETFGAHVSSRATPTKTQGKTPAKSGRDTDRPLSSSRAADRQEAPRPDPFLGVTPARLQPQGGVLLGLLLQQPLSPSSLSLSHLLTLSATDIRLQVSGLSTGHLPHTDAPARMEGGGGVSRAALTSVQSLAGTGLNMLSQSRAAAAASNRKHRSCPGAVLLLPLLELHLSRLCQALDSLSSTSAGTSGSDSASTSLSAGRAAAAAAAGRGRQEEVDVVGFSLEDTGLAALRVLYLLLSHSDEVVESVLSNPSQTKDSDQVQNQPFARDQLSKADHSPAGPPSQNALLRSALQLCDVGFGGSGSQREALVHSSLKILCALMERTPHVHSDRLQCVFQRMCASVSADTHIQTLSECVSVLVSVCDHPTLAQQLCSQHDPCVFTKLLQFIRSRPGEQASHADLILLDLQVIRLLSRLTQRAESWITRQHSSCLCYTEVVQAVVIVLHRQWLDVRDSLERTVQTDADTCPLPRPAPSSPWWRGPAASLLRECLLLLHWLLLHHGSFSESCRPLLHMYDQVIPAVRDTLRKIPELSECEELALEEVCRSEGDDTDDMDTDTGC